MSDINGASDSGDSTSLSFDEGLSALLKSEAQANSADAEQSEEQDDEQEAEAGDEALDDDQGGEAEAEADEQSEDEPDEGLEEYAQGRFAADNARVKLEDGSTITIAELKAGTLRQGDYTRKMQEHSREREAFQAERSGVQQQMEGLRQNAQFLATLARQYLPTEPPPPDMSLAQTDPLSLNEQIAAWQVYHHKVAELNRIMGISREGEAQQHQEMEAQASQRRQAEVSLLLEKMPELRDEAKRTAFSKEIGDVMTNRYGFKPEELGFEDHRLFLVARDLARLHRIDAAKPKVQQKTEGKPPVLQPSKRPSAPEMRARSIKAADDRLRSDRSLDAGVAALLARENAG